MRPKHLVSRGNLDDRLATVHQWQHDHEKIAVERWSSHRDTHEVVAEALRDYKKDANEWRSTLTDLRTTFIPKAEYMAEHRALDAKLHGEIEALSNLVRGEFEKLSSIASTLDTRIDVNTSDIKDVRAYGLNRRSVFNDGRSVLTAVGIAFGIIASALLIIDRLKP